jgi:beta-fructofuranosidase
MHRRNFLQATGLLPFLGSQVFTTHAFAKTAGISAPASSREFFYRPENAWAADFIPLYANGEFQLFYLLDWRDKGSHGEGTPWYRISSKDFVNFQEHGEMLKRGSEAEQDLYVFTGSAIQAKDGFHIFYTGHNPHLRQQGKPEQGVMHAVSKDMITWTKLPAQTFFAPSDKYEKDDWRDPFVFWNPDTNKYNMLLAARHKEGIARRRGLTALCTSADLVKWDVEEPFYSPGLYFTHECPDLFKMGDWWYLLFSEFTDKVRTRYRMSRSLKGPWTTPERDDFDGHAFYAAKSASDGKNRFLFGWNPTRDGAKDNGSWDWGGNLVVHELYQQKDGQLGVKIPRTVAGAFTKKSNPSFQSGTGKYTFTNGALHLNATETYAAAVGGVLPDLCRIHASVKFEKGTKEFGLMFHTSDDLDKTYYIRVEPGNNRVVFDMWPRERAEVAQMVELERPLVLANDEPVNMQVIIEGNKGVAYINDVIAMNFRAYDLPAGNWGFFATNGSATFSNIEISTI